MNTELLGKSNEELIQWALIHGAVDETKFRKLFPKIELFCATHSIGLYFCIEMIIEMVNCGFSLRKSFKIVKGFQWCRKGVRYI